MRFDSGFWSNATIATLERLDVGYTMGMRMVKPVVKAISEIYESAWTPIDYTADGEAEVAECDYKGRRLIVRRTRLVGHQAQLFPTGGTSRSSPTSEATQSRWTSSTEPRNCRARDQRPERRLRARTRPVRGLLRQRGVADLRSARP